MAPSALRSAPPTGRARSPSLGRGTARRRSGASSRRSAPGPGAARSWESTCSRSPDTALLRQPVPEADRVDGAAAQQLLHLGAVGGVLDDVRTNLVDREVDDLLHLVGVL